MAAYLCFTFTGLDVNNGATFKKAYVEQEKIGADVLREFCCSWNLLPDHMKDSAEEILRIIASALLWTQTCNTNRALFKIYFYFYLFTSIVVCLLCCV